MGLVLGLRYAEGNFQVICVEMRLSETTGQINRYCLSATSTKHFLLASQMLLTHQGIKLACPFPITFAEPTVVESIRLICTLATSRT
jgi:hypothetical protein